MMLSVGAIFDKMRLEVDRSHTFEFSCFEIYDDKMYDLLQKRSISI